jgi:hypothetical protein
MTSLAHAAPVSNAKVWTARIMAAIAVLFLLVDGTGKALTLAPYIQGSTQLGYPESTVLPLGLLELVCVVIYLIPRTRVFGAILLTGYMGGAIATHVRVGSPFATHIFFPIYVAILLWGAIYLRDERVRALIPVRS